MTERINRQRVEQIRVIREAQNAEAMRRLATSLHEQFCDEDQQVGGWDEAVVTKVLNDFFDLPNELHSALVATLALERSKPKR